MVSHSRRPELFWMMSICRSSTKHILLLQVWGSNIVGYEWGVRLQDYARARPCKLPHSNCCNWRPRADVQLDVNNWPSPSEQSWPRASGRRFVICKFVHHKWNRKWWLWPEFWENNSHPRDLSTSLGYVAKVCFLPSVYLWSSIDSS